MIVRVSNRCRLFGSGPPVTVLPQPIKIESAAPTSAVLRVMLDITLVNWIGEATRIRAMSFWIVAEL